LFLPPARHLPFYSSSQKLFPRVKIIKPNAPAALSAANGAARLLASLDLFASLVATQQCCIARIAASLNKMLTRLR